MSRDCWLKMASTGCILRHRVNGRISTGSRGQGGHYRTVFFWKSKPNGTTWYREVTCLGVSDTHTHTHTHTDTPSQHTMLSCRCIYLSSESGFYSLQKFFKSRNNYFVLKVTRQGPFSLSLYTYMSYICIYLFFNVLYRANIKFITTAGNKALICLRGRNECT